jgi:cyclopropane fatty-acyl-phospholipid synthase-like methyltransferase
MCNKKIKKLDYRSFVGPEYNYYETGEKFFQTLKHRGLSQDSKVADVGCGSLRIGRLLIPFLKEGNYYGIEPEIRQRLAGMRNELSKEILKIKKPKFSNTKAFSFKEFGGVKFDYILAMQVFIHCGVKQFKKFLTNSIPVLKPNGEIIINIKFNHETTEEPWPKREGRYPDSSHRLTLYKMEDFMRILNQNNLNSEWITRYRRIGCSIKRTNHLLSLSKKQQIN